MQKFITYMENNQPNIRDYAKMRKYNRDLEERYPKDVTLKSTGRIQTIYYFSKDSRSTACDKPDGYHVKENTRTGLPFLTKKG